MITAAQLDQCFGERPLFVEGGETTTYAEFASHVEQQTASLDSESLAKDRLVSHCLSWTAESYARFLALLENGYPVYLGNPVPEADLSIFENSGGLLVLRTGGTTGASRHVVHDMARLCQPYTLQEKTPVRLLVLYAPDHIAGLDAFLQALHRGSLLVVPDNRTPSGIAGAIEQHRVEVLPATPTFLQFLLLSGELEGRDLDSVRVIPHGAEPMHETLRSRIQAAFPMARLMQRFGLTELGALPVREDPDDPQALFLGLKEGEVPAGYAWKIEDDELLIQSPSRMLGTLEEGPVNAGTHWYRTGDLAALTPRGSVRILGRRESLINVGGSKVLPETVESLLLAQSQVSDAEVFGQPNPLTGESVVAQVVFNGEPAPLELMRALRVAARKANLSLAHVPTRIEAVTCIQKTAFGKRTRNRVKT